MANKNKTYTISEYGLLGTDEAVESYNRFASKQIENEEVFKEFEAFAKTDYGKDVLGFAKNGEYLQAKNYVGTIQTLQGDILEILPKIYNDDKELHNSKKIFLELLRILHRLPNFKHIEKANFDINDMPLLEIFIVMFLDEVGVIIKKGIKSDYIAKEDNLFYLKGKLLMSEQIKQNTIHKERFFVEYDEYSPNRAENRLIKSTLKYLLSISKDEANIRLLRMYQEHMNLVEYSTNIDKDLRSIKTDRGVSHYRDALVWARVFLKHNSFSSFSGDTIAFAILYPMEKLFENYIEHELNEKYPQYDILAQSGEEVFVKKESGKKLFGVRPDFLIKENGRVIIVADAKWKIIDENKSFSQSDFYQLYAYKRIYSEEQKKIKLQLYYPMSEFFIVRRKYKYFDEAEIIAIPIDMNEIIEN